MKKNVIALGEGHRGTRYTLILLSHEMPTVKNRIWKGIGGSAVSQQQEQKGQERNVNNALGPGKAFQPDTSAFCLFYVL